MAFYLAEEKGFVYIFAHGKDKGFARSSPREQQSTGLLHLIVRIPYAKRKTTLKGWLFFLAEEKGFEPLRRFHALRDFESRLFDQLEYSSV